jgi:hypothetical protein
LAAAAVGIIAFGGGGFALGQRTSGVGNSTSFAVADSLLTAEAAAGGAAADRAETSAAAPAAAIPAPEDPPGAQYVLAPPAARTFVAQGLSNERGTAEVSAFDAESVSAGGTPPSVTSLGSREIVSPVEAVARLNDARFGTTQLTGPPVESRESGLSDVPRADSPVPWPLPEVTITSASLEYAEMTVGTVTFTVPIYVLTDPAGNSWSVIALVEADLDFATGG